MEPNAGLSEAPEGHAQGGGISHFLWQAMERTVPSAFAAAAGGGAGRARESSDDLDLEQPFLLSEEPSPRHDADWEHVGSPRSPHGAGEQGGGGGNDGGEAGEAEAPPKSPKQWPALRWGSVSTRRFSPSPFVDMPLPEQQLLLSMGSGGLGISPPGRAPSLPHTPVSARSHTCVLCGMRPPIPCC